MKNWIKVYCRIAWDSDPGIRAKGFIYLKMFNGVVINTDEIESIKYTGEGVELRLVASRATYFITIEAWHGFHVVANR